VKGSSKGSGKSDFRRSVTESKIQQALLKKKMESAIADKPITFEKILLKFDKLRTVTGYIKTMFNEVAVDGHLSHEGLEAIMKRLGVDMTLSEMLDLFDFINVQEQKTISIKEFLVALTVGMVLDAIPALVAQEKNPHDPIERRVSGFLGHQTEIKDMLSLIVSAYLLFDPQGKGYIERSGIEKTLEEHGKGGGHGGKNSAVLSQQRWAEMVSGESAVIHDHHHDRSKATRVSARMSLTSFFLLLSLPVGLGCERHDRLRRVRVLLLLLGGRGRGRVKRAEGGDHGGLSARTALCVRRMVGVYIQKG
jgi:Ca2+-binding EF-hand superfamily protein